MANSTAKTKREAESIAAVCNELAGVLTRINQILEHNGDLAIDWGAAETPAYVSEDADGNIADLTFSRANVSNAIGTLNAVRTLLTGGTPTTGDHLGNVNQLARPLG